MCRLRSTGTRWDRMSGIGPKAKCHDVRFSAAAEAKTELGSNSKLTRMTHSGHRRRCCINAHAPVDTNESVSPARELSIPRTRTHRISPRLTLA